MIIDKTDFVNALAEFGSEILVNGSPTKGFFVLLQSDKDLPDVHLQSGDAIAYVDPATVLAIGDSLTHQGRPFTLVSKVKVKYVGDNPIYRLLGLELSSRLPPYLLIASAYSYEEISTEEVSVSFFLPSVYSYEEISSEDVSASFFLPSVYSYEEISSEDVSASFFLPASYTISSELFSLSIFSSYSYEEISSEEVSMSFFLPSVYSYEEISSENVSASFFLPSVYSYEEISSEDVSASFFLPASYTISSKLFSLSIFSSYSYEEISSEDVSAGFFLPSVYSYEEISSENISASFFLPSVYSYEEISSVCISAAFFLPSIYSIAHLQTISFDSVPLVNPQMQDMYYRVLANATTLKSGKQSVQSSSEVALTVKFVCSTFNHADITNLRAKIGSKATLVIGSDSISCYINAKAFVERQLRENNLDKYEYEVEFIEHTI